MLKPHPLQPQNWEGKRKAEQSTAFLQEIGACSWGAGAACSWEPHPVPVRAPGQGRRSVVVLLALLAAAGREEGRAGAVSRVVMKQAHWRIGGLERRPPPVQE